MNFAVSQLQADRRLNYKLSSKAIFVVGGITYTFVHELAISSSISAASFVILWYLCSAQQIPDRLRQNRRLSIFIAANSILAIPYVS